MKSGLWFVIGLSLAVSCFGQERTRDNVEKRDSIKISGMENINREFYDHFSELLSEGFEATENGVIDVTEKDNEKVVIFNDGEQLQVYLLVEGKDGKFQTALKFETELNFEAKEGEEVELYTTVLISDPVVINKSVRLSQLQTSIKEGKSLSKIVSEQVAAQVSSTRLTSEEPTARTTAVSVDCSGSDSAVCCGFSDGKKTRIMCVCNAGSGKWVLCFDSDWK